MILAILADYEKFFESKWVNMSRSLCATSKCISRAADALFVGCQ